jgi:uncharacterized membrane protein
MASVVADHFARTLLRQSYEDLAEIERGLIDRIVDLAPLDPVPTPKVSWFDVLADFVARASRSWWFLAAFVAIIAAWIWINSAAMRPLGLAFDPYPYTGLRFGLSLLASVQGVLILMSSHHNADAQKLAAEYDAAVNLHAKLEIMRIHERLDTVQDMLQRADLKPADGVGPRLLLGANDAGRDLAGTAA